jgi:hypothetical protein
VGRGWENFEVRVRKVQIALKSLLDGVKTLKMVLVKSQRKGELLMPTGGKAILVTNSNKLG